jgi:hypothetical protein
MARKVFFSFKYDDVQRAMNVRNSNVIKGAIKSGFIDKADFEEVERKGGNAIKSWIDKQLEGTTVTVVLIGANTNKSHWVNYEIEQSIKRGNGILTIDISKIKDLDGKTSDCCSLRVPGYNHYLWNKENGRDNLGDWVEAAAVAAGK